MTGALEAAQLRVGRLALLANPESGSGSAGEAEGLLRSHGAEVNRFTLDEVEEALASQPDRIVLAGGDGSVGCAAEAAARARAPLAVIATGTANDFARALDLPDELEAACALAAEGTDTRRLDLARIDGRPFVNIASAGLAPMAARRARGLKRALGPLAYTVGALRAALGASPIRCRVEIDGEPFFAGRAWQLSVACTGAFGGGSTLAADPEDGRLDVVVLKAGGRRELLARAYGLRRGTVEQQDGVRDARGREVRVQTDGTEELLGFNVDGELIGHSSATLTVEPRAYEVIVG